MISTKLFFENSVGGINNINNSIYKLNKQINSMKRVVTPADDPVASARILSIRQTESRNQQFSLNINDANSALSLSSKAMKSMGDILTSMKTLAVQAGNGHLTDEDYVALQNKFKGYLEQLVSLSNSQDSQGNYLFSGTKGSTPPFTLEGSFPYGSEVKISYNGDDGQKSIYVSAQRQIAISDPGAAFLGDGSKDQKMSSIFYTALRLGEMLKQGNDGKLNELQYIPASRGGVDGGRNSLQLLVQDSMPVLLDKAVAKDFEDLKDALGSYENYTKAGVAFDIEVLTDRDGLQNQLDIRFTTKRHVNLTGALANSFPAGDAYQLGVSGQPMLLNAEGMFNTDRVTFFDSNSTAPQGKFLILPKGLDPRTASWIVDNNNRVSVDDSSFSFTQENKNEYVIWAVPASMTLNALPAGAQMSDPRTINTYDEPGFQQTGLSVRLNGSIRITNPDGTSAWALPPFPAAANVQNNRYKVTNLDPNVSELKNQSGVEASMWMKSFKVEQQQVLSRLDTALLQVTKYAALLGIRQAETTQLKEINEGVGLIYTTTISSLEDLDFPKASAELIAAQTALQASQLAFSRLSSLGLFQYL